MRFLNLIIEIITAPFTLLLKSNGISVNTNRWCKPLIILFIALLILAVLILYFYRGYLFNIGVD